MAWCVTRLDLNIYLCSGPFAGGCAARDTGWYQWKVFMPIAGSPMDTLPTSGYSRLRQNPVGAPQPRHDKTSIYYTYVQPSHHSRGALRLSRVPSHTVYVTVTGSLDRKASVNKEAAVGRGHN